MPFRKSFQHGPAAVVALLLVAACIGTFCLACGPRPVGSVRPSEETSSPFLERELGMALDSLADARGELGTDPVAASESLDRARRSLLRLRDYYVPLLEARELSHRAQLWFQAGEPAHTLEDLEATEDLLLRISDQGDPQLSRELDAPLRTVVQARAAVRSDRREAPELIERIENEIQMLLLKGQLVLHQTHLSEWQRSEL